MVSPENWIAGLYRTWLTPHRPVLLSVGVEDQSRCYCANGLPAGVLAAARDDAFHVRELFHEGVPQGQDRNHSKLHHRLAFVFLCSVMELWCPRCLLPLDTLESLGERIVLSLPRTVCATSFVELYGAENSHEFSNTSCDLARDMVDCHTTAGDMLVLSAALDPLPTHTHTHKIVLTHLR